MRFIFCDLFFHTKKTVTEISNLGSLFILFFSIYFIFFFIHFFFSNLGSLFNRPVGRAVTRSSLEREV